MPQPDFIVSPRHAVALYAGYEAYRASVARTVSLPPVPVYYDRPERPAPAKWVQ